MNNQYSIYGLILEAGRDGQTIPFWTGSREEIKGVTNNFGRYHPGQIFDSFLRKGG